MTLGFAPEAIELGRSSGTFIRAERENHGSDHVLRIAASIDEFGWTVPVLVAEDGEVIAGHGRILATTELG